MRSKNRSIMAGFLLIIVLTAADWVSKFLAARNLAGTAGISLIPGVFEFFYVENYGAAFGILNNRQFFFILIAIIIFAAAVFVYIRTPAGRHYYPLCVSCILIAAGSAGNMADRIIHGYVIDFLYFSLIDFPVFNLADCYVCAGAVLAIILLFTLYRKDEFAFLKLKNKK